MQVHSGTVKIEKKPLILKLLNSATGIFSYTYYVMLTAASKITIKYIIKINHSLFPFRYNYVRQPKAPDVLSSKNYNGQRGIVTDENFKLEISFSS